MKLVILWISIACGSLANCIAQDSFEFPFEFGKEYYFITPTVEMDIDSKYANTITFQSDGTYIRTEDSSGFSVELTEEHVQNHHMIYIDSLNGQWYIEDSKIYLNDVKFLSFYCMSFVDGQKVECNVKPSIIAMGLHEWFIDFTIWATEEIYLYVEPKGM